jgi:hypothetical protein
MSTVEELQKVGFASAISLEKLLQDQQAHRQMRGSVAIVDEAGMVSGNQMPQLLRLAEQHSARIVFSGDTRQIQSVEACDALRVLEKESGLKSCSLTQGGSSSKVALGFSLVNLEVVRQVWQRGSEPKVFANTATYRRPSILCHFTSTTLSRASMAVPRPSTILHWPASTLHWPASTATGTRVRTSPDMMRPLATSSGFSTHARTDGATISRGQGQNSSEVPPIGRVTIHVLAINLDFLAVQQVLIDEQAFPQL